MVETSYQKKAKSVYNYNKVERELGVSCVELGWLGLRNIRVKLMWVMGR